MPLKCEEAAFLWVTSFAHAHVPSRSASGAIPAKALMDMLVNDGTVVQVSEPPLPVSEPPLPVSVLATGLTTLACYHTEYRSRKEEDWQKQGFPKIRLSFELPVYWLTVSLLGCVADWHPPRQRSSERGHQ